MEVGDVEQNFLRCIAIMGIFNKSNCGAILSNFHIMTTFYTFHFRLTVDGKSVFSNFLEPLVVQ